MPPHAVTSSGNSDIPEKISEGQAFLIIFRAVARVVGSVTPSLEKALSGNLASCRYIVGIYEKFCNF